MLIADENIKNENKLLPCCLVVLCVNSCNVDETAAHHGGEKGRLLTVPIHRFIWVIYKTEQLKKERIYLCCILGK